MFVDTEHAICYMNKAAVAHYKGGEALPGTSVLDCHNERSCEVIGYYERYAPPGRKLNVEHGPSKD
jgi:hypothetical protein